MEEVDKIIIHSLKDIGCNINDEINSLEEFNTQLIIEAASKCLSAITTGLEVPDALPQNMAARFQVGASIAEACKKLGYMGEVGYQTFLYSNVIEVRKVFMFLIEKLPREQEKTAVDTEEPLIKLKGEIGKAMKSCLGKRLELKDVLCRPFISVALETGINLPGVKKRMLPQAWREYCLKDLPFITEQTDCKLNLTSLTTVNLRSRCDLESVEITKGSTPNAPVPRPVARLRRFNNTWLAIHEHILFSEDKVKVSVHSAVSDAPLNSNVNKESEVMNKDKVETEEEQTICNNRLELESLRAKVEEIQASITSVNSLLRESEKEYDLEMIASEQRTVEIQAHNKAVELLDDHETSVEKLDKITASIRKKLLSLASQWEQHRKPLLERCRQSRANLLICQKESEKQLETISNLKNKLELVNKQIGNKRLARDKLQQHYDQLPKNIKRSAYTRRILEIIGNIKKQRDEIDKVLKDMKSLQKDKNLLSEKLERLYTVTEETIFRNSKKDEHSKRTLKLLTTLHSDCKDIVGLVQETGATVREIRELEEQIEIESCKNIGANLKRITADLKQMKEENISLNNQLKIVEP